MKDMKEYDNNSVFNMGIATLIRIDRLMVKASECKIIGQAKGYSFTPTYEKIIRELYKELYPFLKKEDVEEAKTKFLEILNGNPIAYENSSIRVKAIFNETLEEFDFWIRYKLKEKGLLMIQGQDPHTAIQNG